MHSKLLSAQQRTASNNASPLQSASCIQQALSISNACLKGAHGFRFPRLVRGALHPHSLLLVPVAAPVRSARPICHVSPLHNLATRIAARPISTRCHPLRLIRYFHQSLQRRPAVSNKCRRSHAHYLPLENHLRHPLSLWLWHLLLAHRHSSLLGSRPTHFYILHSSRFHSVSTRNLPCFQSHSDLSRSARISSFTICSLGRLQMVAPCIAPTPPNACHLAPSKQSYAKHLFFAPISCAPSFSLFETIHLTCMYLCYLNTTDSPLIKCNLPSITTHAMHISFALHPSETHNTPKTSLETTHTM